MIPLMRVSSVCHQKLLHLLHLPLLRGVRGICVLYLDPEDSKPAAQTIHATQHTYCIDLRLMASELSDHVSRCDVPEKHLLVTSN